MTFRIALCLLFGALGPALAAEESRPNILLIFTDDQGIHDVGCYGSEIPTPNIDRIAEQGAKFTQFYSASSICTPSRFGLLTGRNPIRSRHQLLSALMFMADEHKSTGIQRGETTIAEVLRDEGGYDTALIGKWHLGHGQDALLPLAHGFDHFIGHTGGCIDFFTMTYGIIPDWYNGSEHVSENGYATELITEEAIAYLESRGETDDPFFLYLAYNAPHFGKGYSPGEGKPVNLMQPQASELKRVAAIPDKIRREFAAMTVSLDDGVGNVLTALKRLELEDDTLVLFITDHGGDPVYGGSNLPFRGQKATLFEGGIRVPCLVRWPGRIAPGTEITTPTIALDLFPTFCSLAGIDSSDLIDTTQIDGVDISPLLLGESLESTPREFLWMTGKHAELEREPWLALRSGGLKYLRSPTEGEFLFDLDTDPYETTDLKSERPEDFARLRDRAARRSVELQPASAGNEE